MKYHFLCLLLTTMSFTLKAQRGDIIIPTGASLTVPLNAQICADRIYANNPGYGTLTLADPSCLCSGAAVVPVELLAFSGALVNGRVHLSWTTASETNCAGFGVQRSSDEATWLQLGFVEGHGTTTEEHSYVFDDPLQPPLKSDVQFYRLRVIDTDGTHRYLPAVEVRIDREILAPALTAVYPNPATDCLTIGFAIPGDTSVEVVLYSMAGAVLMRFRQYESLPRGHHVFQASVRNLPSGDYIVALVAGGTRLTHQVLVIR